ncbi:unnamed protein product [Peniophora sp. CBMAI 1063]|nr:unnamed protein product [Peniophora sp. CBMAI 1063]
MKDASTLNLARFRFSPTSVSTTPRTKSSSPAPTLEYATRDLSLEYLSSPYPLTSSERALYRTASGAKVPQHHWEVYDACLKVPAGRVTTYGVLCKHIGSGSARSVGRALATNPFAPRIPCHRVLPATLFAGGFRGNAPVHPSQKLNSKKSAREDGEGEDNDVQVEEIKWNWHDSVKVEGAEAVRREKVRMLALEGVRFGGDGKLVGGVGAVWKFEDDEESECDGEE